MNLNPPNPYESFPSAGASDAAAPPSDAGNARPLRQLVARLWMPVICMMVACGLFSLGNLAAVFAGARYYYWLTNSEYVETVNQTLMVRSLVGGILKSALMCLGLAALTSLLWRYASAIRRAARDPSLPLTSIFERQRQCWIAGACFALGFTVYSLGIALFLNV